MRSRLGPVPRRMVLNKETTRGYQVGPGSKERKVVTRRSEFDYSIVERKPKDSSEENMSNQYKLDLVGRVPQKSVTTSMPTKIYSAIT